MQPCNTSTVVYCFVNTILQLQGPANDPTTANDPQFGPKTGNNCTGNDCTGNDCTANEMVFSLQRKKLGGLRNSDSGFISFIFLKITNSQ